MPISDGYEVLSALIIDYHADAFLAPSAIDAAIAKAADEMQDEHAGIASWGTSASAQASNAAAEARTGGPARMRNPGT